MASGYMGKVLVLDLGTREINEEEIPEAVYKKYLSGMGLGAYILYNRIPKGADPLGPDNMLGFVSGLLTATGSIITGRWMVTGKSPLTGGWGDANCGGTFSPAIKRCGYDGVFFTGISKDPVYLYIDPKGVPELKDASDLWGNDAVETEEMLIERHGKSAKVACIGPAGEKLSLISGVCNDKGRIAARSGLGALMGSKRLKALCLAGRKKIEVYDKAGMKGLTKKASDFISKGSSVPLPPGSALPYIGAMMRIMPTQMAQDGLLFKLLLQKWGTVFQNQYSIEAGDSPIKNWKGTNKDFGASKSKTTNADVFIRVQTRKYHCYSCPIGCGGICSTTGKYSETHKPEYETVLALGGLLMNDDPEMIFYLNEVLNRAGMDSISAGSTVAFAMECLENGLISASDIDGIDLTWGNTEAIIAFIEKMTAREGNIGELFADGTKKASERIGQGSDAFAIHAGGQELPMHDPRNDPGYAIHYSAEPTPGRHTIGSQISYEMYKLWKMDSRLPKVRMLYHKDSKFDANREKAVWAKACSDYMNVVNASGLCWFGAMMGCERVPVFDWLNAATGWNMSAEEYMDAGERIQTLKQAFNIKHGINPKAFCIKDRVAGIPPQGQGANKGRSVDVDQMVSDYWREYGWDPETGRPKGEITTEFSQEAVPLKHDSGEDIIGYEDAYR